MLYVMIEEPGRTADFGWHIGEKSPITFPQIRSVVEVQADGDERMWLIGQFENLPYHKGAIQRWYGDAAKMIASWLVDYRPK